jgi:hypothetical protein
MARPRQKNFVERLADVGEEAIQRIGNAPGADRLLGTLNSVRDRVDELQKRVRGLEELEKRLATVEQRLDKLEGKSSRAARKTTSSSSKSSTTRKTAPS